MQTPEFMKLVQQHLARHPEYIEHMEGKIRSESSLSAQALMFHQLARTQTLAEYTAALLSMLEVAQGALALIELQTGEKHTQSTAREALLKFPREELVLDQLPSLHPECTYRVATEQEMPLLLRRKLHSATWAYLLTQDSRHLTELHETLLTLHTHTNSIPGPVTALELQRKTFGRFETRMVFIHPQEA